MTSLSDPVFAQAAADPEQEAARGAGTVLTYQQLADACDYPLHVGVTEAGGTRTGTVKSSIGMGLAK